jgi:hypothetical protein
MLLTLNKEFLKFLNSIFSQNSILKDTFHNFDDYFNYLKNSINIPIDYDKYLLNFPYYPNNYKYIKDLYPSGSNFKISTQKIVSAIPVDNLYLKKENYIDEIISTNTLIEKIPININSINFSFLTQNIIINDNYTNNFLWDYLTKSVPDSYNLSYNLLTNTTQTIHESSYNNISVLNLINLYNIFYNFYIQNFNFNEDFLNFVLTTNESDGTFTNNKLKSTFEEFITNTNSYFDNNEIFKNLCKLILKNNFNIIKPTDYILNNFTQYYIDNEINNISTAFSNFIDNDFLDTFINRLNTTLTNIRNKIYYNIFNIFITEDLNNFIVDIISLNGINNIFDSDIINQFVKDINKFELKNYLLPIYNYSINPIKFINILMPFITDFVQKYLVTNKKYNELIGSDSFFKNAINEVIERLISENNETGLNNLTNFFNNINIRSIYNDNNLGSLFSFLFMKEIIIEFYNSNYFNDFVINSLENLNICLYNNKIIPYNYNYYNNIDIIRSYYKTFFLKYSIKYNDDTGEINNYIYPDLKLKIDEFFNTTDLTFEITENKLLENITSQINNYKLYTNNYNLTKNIYQSYITKLIYQKILTFYSIPKYSANNLNFENILDPINEINKTLNKMVYDNTTNKYLYASGILSDSPWIDNQNNIIYTPIIPEFIASFIDFEDINNPINTINKYLNKMVWDTNNNIYVYSSGILPESTWNDINGNLKYTPTQQNFIADIRDFENIADPININSKYTGKKVWDNTTEQYLYASGSLPESSWKNISGIIVYMPDFTYLSIGEDYLTLEDDSKLYITTDSLY